MPCIQGIQCRYLWRCQFGFPPSTFTPQDTHTVCPQRLSTHNNNPASYGLSQLRFQTNTSPSASSVKRGLWASPPIQLANVTSQCTSQFSSPIHCLKGSPLGWDPLAGPIC